MAQLLNRLFLFLASLKLALTTMSIIIVVLAAGTFVESLYDAKTASELIYHNPLVFAVFSVFAINLICAAISRLPWQKKHADFLCAHLGILLILLGSLITHSMGLDAVLRLEPNQMETQLQLDQDELLVYQDLQAHLGSTPDYQLLSRHPLQFNQLTPAQINQPLNLRQALSGSFVHFLGLSSFLQSWNGSTHPNLWLKEYLANAQSQVSKQPSTDILAPKAILIALDSPKIKSEHWVTLLNQQSLRGLQKKQPLTYPESWTEVGSVDLGPLQLQAVFEKTEHLELPKNCAKNTVLLHLTQISPQPQSSLYACSLKNPRFQKIPLKNGSDEDTSFWSLPWMGIKLYVKKVYAHAQDLWLFTPVKQEFGQAEMGTSGSAIRLELAGESVWVAYKTPTEWQSKNAKYLFLFQPIIHTLKTPLTLNRFEIQYYPGTQKPKEYLSVLNYGPQQNPASTRISMNEPFSLDGLTFYQTSYEEDPQGKPIASILSVNYDPGRYLKYLGAIILVLGIVWMFYTRNQKMRVRSTRVAQAV